MSRMLSRRDFLAGGVVICSGVSAVTIYMLPGGRATPRVELDLVTGEDPTGARDLLVDTWNNANPNAPVNVREVSGSTIDQRREMIDAINSNNADVINLDIIDIPYFGDQGLIEEIELDDSTFLEQALLPSRVDNKEGRYWAAPFNTDVGMLFERLPSHQADGTDRGLAEVVDDEASNGSPQFVGQLNATDASREVFVVNVLEHALAREGEVKILDESGVPQYELTEWEKAMEPLRAAIAAKRILPTVTEEDSRNEFSDRRLRYMRNWPVKYRELQQENDADATASRILVRPLPVGVLGGQSLALVSQSRHESQARKLISFLTSNEAQKVLAAHGLAPTRVAAYNDENLRAFIPHLTSIRDAVAMARPRPINRNYSEFSGVVFLHLRDFLMKDGKRLRSNFIDEMRDALGN
ncbi:extracellular solute-binding protein [Actinomycetes bacterium KLBMP 9797]